MNNSLEYANPVDWDLYRKTVAELKQIIGALKIPTRRISAMKKHELRQHIERFLLEASSIAVIGRFIALYREAFFNRLLAKLRGEFQGTLDKCVNETDFYTLEPLANIPQEQYYGVFENGFWYGFDIVSLLCLKSKGFAMNPYTRTPFGEETLMRVFRIMRILKILRDYKTKKKQSTTDAERLPQNEMSTRSPAHFHFASTSTSTSTSIPTAPTAANRFLGNTIYPPRANLSESQCRILNHLIEVRQNTIDSRITQLFMEIDYLGNYTNSRWFRDLATNAVIRLFHFLQDFWENQRNLSATVKWQICSLTGTPFYNIFIVNFNALSRDEIVEACVLIMENMVFTGCDEEARKLGAMQVLMNLANVSEDARQSLPWF
jgi:hypothetical protein